MFYLIGLGLGDAKDITVRGLEIVRDCDKLYLESYTSLLTVGKQALEKFYERQVIIADRETCENGAVDILRESKEKDVALLVVGDPLSATTHTDILLRAHELDVPYRVVHNASITNAVGCCGLQLYRFGETVSIPYWTDTWKPDSYFDKIMGNYDRGLHTLCLLDIKVKEPTEESLTKKVRVYMEPKFMSVAEAATQLLQIIRSRSGAGIDENSLIVGVARVGTENQELKVGPLADMCRVDLGDPLHSMVVPAKELHPLEEDFLKTYGAIMKNT